MHDEVKTIEAAGGQAIVVGDLNAVEVTARDAAGNVATRRWIFKIAR